MRVVSNTSPLSNLAIIGRLSLVFKQFDSVIIPQAVSDELDRLRHPTGQAAVRLARQDGLLAVAAVGNQAAADILGGQLDRGEAEAIVLAAELSADWLLIDERAGRLLAKRARLRITGVLGILARAKLAGQIPLMRPELQALRAEAHFFLRPNLEREVLATVGE